MPAEGENASVLTPRPPKPDKKYFSVADANRALPYVQRIIEDLRGPYGRVMDISRKLELIAGGQTREQLESEFEHERAHLNTLIEELQAVGVELKDFDKMLLDFPAIHEGREICLCWRHGESSVRYWHEISAGYAGRQDVALLSKAEK